MSPSRHSHAAGQESLSQAASERLEEAIRSYVQALDAGTPLDPHEWLARYPELTAELQAFLDDQQHVGAALTPLRGEVPARDLTGARFEDYELEEEIGRGGMGVVYRARQLKLNRVVALKMILAGAHAVAEERVRFLAEAEAIAAVKHAGIVQVFDFGSHDGVPFFSLEYCPGGSLAKRLDGTPLPAGEAARLVEQVARAVQAAHEAGIVHRDLKPGNVLLAEDGAPKVTDFGLARRVDAGAGLTHTGAVLGTPSYMAPEQAEGKKDVGPAADVYALGVILYELLTGRPPFKAATPFDTILQVVSDEPVPPRRLNQQVPADLETICLKCLCKEPNKRYARAGELADDLRRWQAGEPIAARPAGRVERAAKWARRRPTAALLLAVSVLAGLGLALLSIVAVHQRQSALAALKGEQEAWRQEEQERSRRGLAQVEALLSVHPRAVPVLLNDLAEQGSDVLPALLRVWNEPDTPRSRPRRMRAALALLAVEPGTSVRDALLKWMLEVPDPAELLVIRETLRPYAAELSGDLWRQVEQSGGTAIRRLRLLAVLAALDPGGPGWKKVDEAALEPWLGDNPLYLGTWIEALRPARDHLLPLLTRLFRSGPAERRPVVASILADYARDRPATLVGLVAEADDRQLANLWPALRRQGEPFVKLLRREVQKQPPPRAGEAAREALARRQSGAAVALARLGHTEGVWPLLAHSPYPEARSRLTLRLGPAGVEARVLVERLEQEKDVSIRRALIQALGEYTREQVPGELRQRLVATLLGWYRHDPDPGIHGAIDWLLRHDREGPNPRPLSWGQAQELARIDDELASRERKRPQQGNPSWYVNGQGQTLAVIDGRQPFLMGSPADEGRRRTGERQHWRQIGRRYAIGTKAVTVAQYQRFRKARPELRQYSPAADGPIILLTWYEAAQYCRWLSEQEGFREHEMVYPSPAEIEKCADGVTPLRLPADYLKRPGYRLPTEAEWEFACRAGTRTSRYYGSSVELLPRYAWYVRNAEDQAWPVGQKRPNDLGLFDMHGNVWTWCQGAPTAYPPGTAARPAGDREDARPIRDSFKIVLRGGSLDVLAARVRSAYRRNNRPDLRNLAVGIRLARTLP